MTKQEYAVREYKKHTKENTIVGELEKNVTANTKLIFKERRNVIWQDQDYLKMRRMHS